MKNELVFHKVALKSKELGCNLLDGIMPQEECKGQNGRANKAFCKCYRQ